MPKMSSLILPIFFSLHSHFDISALTTPTNKILVVLDCFETLEFSFSYPKTENIA